MVRERIEHGAMIEAVRKIEPALITSISVEFSQRFGHTAELGAEHLLQLRFIELGENPFGPGGELDLDFERGAVARVAVSIAQAREGFVQHIPGRPEAVEVKAA